MQEMNHESGCMTHMASRPEETALARHSLLSQGVPPPALLAAPRVLVFLFFLLSQLRQGPNKPWQQAQSTGDLQPPGW